jgi:prevent-host-death family protein
MNPVLRQIAIMAKMVMMTRSRIASFNVAEAKRRFSEIVGQVSYGGATVIITRRGKPMAKLVPVDTPDATAHLADVKGWLERDDPFFSAIEEIIARRPLHYPRALEGQRTTSRRRKAR